MSRAGRGRGGEGEGKGRGGEVKGDEVLQAHQHVSRRTIVRNERDRGQALLSNLCIRYVEL